MQRITKAAIASGAAALLLVGGAYTLAYWTGSGSGDSPALSSGTLEVGAVTCGGTSGTWVYADPTDTTKPGTEEVSEGVVPGDIVYLDCTMSLSGTGDHLKVNVGLDSSKMDAADISASETVDLTTGAVTLTTDAGATISGTGTSTDPYLIDLSTSTGAVTVDVLVKAVIAYGDANTAPPTTPVVIMASLTDAVSLTVTQVNPNA